MNILFIVKEFPHSKVIGGPIIIYNRVKYLSPHHLVSLAAFAQDPTPEQIDSIRPFLVDLRRVPVPHKQSLPRETINAGKARIPPYFYPYYSKEMYHRLGEMVRSIRYDVIISEYSMVAQYLYHNPDLEGMKRVMSVHECYYLARKKAFRVEGINREGLLALYNMAGLKRFEFNMYADADKVLVLTPQGKDELLSVRSGLDISVVPHGVDVEKFRPAPRPEGPPTVMFLGNYPHEPNRDAVIFFGTKVWPLIKKKVPDARFLVVGREPTPDILKLSRHDKSIEVTGVVEDVRPYLYSSDVFVCPVRMGGGFRGKVLEAMACEKVVVSTELGAEGIPAREGENIMLGETPKELAQATLKMLTDKESAARISKNAREMVVKEFSWQRGVEILEEVLEEVVEG